MGIKSSLQGTLGEDAYDELTQTCRSMPDQATMADMQANIDNASA